MYQHPRKYQALKTPPYPGGTKAMQEFIAKNVQYPEEAKAANIGGSVIVGYEITDNGVVQNAHVIRGLGYGCDEEALRVVKLLRYDKVKNKRFRVKVTTKTTIHFNLNQLNISYSVAEPAKEEDKKPGPEEEGGNVSYTYTINY